MNLLGATLALALVLTSLPSVAPDDDDRVCFGTAPIGDVPKSWSCPEPTSRTLRATISTVGVSLRLTTLESPDAASVVVSVADTEWRLGNKATASVVSDAGDVVGTMTMVAGSSMWHQRLDMAEGCSVVIDGRDVGRGATATPREAGSVRYDLAGFRCDGASITVSAP